MSARTTQLKKNDDRAFEVGVEGMDGDYDHIHVYTATPEEAFREAEKKADLTEPVNAYQAYEVGEGVTYYP